MGSPHAPVEVVVSPSRPEIARVTGGPRGDLDGALSIVRDGLLADAAGPGRGAALCAGLRRLRTDLSAHVAATEGPGGLYEEIRRADPRFCHVVRRLRDEHARLGHVLDEVLGGLTFAPGEPEVWSRLRPRVLDLLVSVRLHRGRDMRLAYEAVAIDLGGQG